MRILALKRLFKILRILWNFKIVLEYYLLYPLHPCCLAIAWIWRDFRTNMEIFTLLNKIKHFNLHKIQPFSVFKTVESIYNSPNLSCCPFYIPNRIFFIIQITMFSPYNMISIQIVIVHSVSCIRRHVAICILSPCSR